MANELILVVEDNEKNRKLVRDVLAFKGYRLAEADPNLFANPRLVRFGVRTSF